MRLVRVESAAEQELFHHQVLVSLALRLSEGASRRVDGAVPLSVSLKRLMEPLEVNAKRQYSSAFVRVFELDHPAHADMLKQALEMGALVVLVDVEDEADLANLREAVLEELQANSTILTCSRPDRVPALLQQRCEAWSLAALGLYMSEVKLSDRDVREVIKRMRQRGGLAGGAHYARVTALHLGCATGASSLASTEVGNESMDALVELLSADGCVLTSLDLSFTLADGRRLVNALRSNASLTVLDVRKIPRMRDSYDALAAVLLQPSCSCPLGFLRCDDFELHQGEEVLDLRERRLAPGATKLLAGLLRFNGTLKELDLTATDVDTEGAQAILATLETNTTLTALRLAHNPQLDSGVKVALEAAAAGLPSLELELN